MKLFSGSVLLLAWLGFVACSPTQVFAPEVMEGVDHNFDFSRWRMLPSLAQEKKIQLGGRILQAERHDGTVTIVMAQLPIVEHPAYGPKDMGKQSGEFTATFNGVIDPPFLQRGNRVIVVGKTRPAKVAVVDDLPRSLPTLSAQCLHIWNTGGREIAEFPSFGAGYEPLENQTFCAASY